MFALLSGVLLAQTVGPIPADTDPPKTIEMLSMDLSAGNYGERRFAGRELRRSARSSKNTLRRAAPDSLEALESRQTLAELRQHTLPACMTQLTEAATGVFCAQILRALEDPSALPTIQAALESEELGFRARRALKKTYATLQESS